MAFKNVAEICLDGWEAAVLAGGRRPELAGCRHQGVSKSSRSCGKEDFSKQSHAQSPEPRVSSCPNIGTRSQYYTYKGFGTLLILGYFGLQGKLELVSWEISAASGSRDPMILWCACGEAPPWASFDAPDAARFRASPSI